MPEDDQFVQKRLLLACVLSAVAITVYTFFAPRPVAPVIAPETGAEPATTAPVPGDPAEPFSESSGEEALPQKSQPVAVSGTQAAESEQEIIVESDTFVVRFSNRGAVVTSWVLKKYVVANGEPLDLVDLVHAGGAKNHGYPFGLALSGGQPVAEINQALFVVNDGFPKRSAPTTVSFEYSDGVHTVRKSFSFQSEGYLVEITSELAESGQARSHLLTWPGGFGDTAQPDDQRYSTTFYYDPSQSELLHNAAGDLEDDRITNVGPYPYVGIDDRFFAAAFMPIGSEMTVQLESSAVAIEPIATGTEATFAALAVGGAQKNQLQLFVGPKSYDTLEAVRPELAEIVDFCSVGFLPCVLVKPLAEPIFWMLRWTHDNVVASYGWGIILVTVFINFVMLPLKWKSSRSMKKMQALQPLIKQINEKYKGLGLRNPKKAKQQEETMALYKKHGVNPLGGCLPMLLMMPFFFAFYTVLTVAIEMRQASWLWVDDLSLPEQNLIRVLPLAMVASQFWMQTLTPTPGTDPAQMRLMKFMPLMMGVLFWSFSSGLVLYWLTSNVVGVLQQLLLNRLPSEPIEIEQPKGRRKKKRLRN